MTIIMVMPVRYDFIYAEATFRHMAFIDRRHYLHIRAAIEEQLICEPNVRTRNRKPLIKPSQFGEVWELRFGPDNRFRVFYHTEESLRRVRILAIGIKIGGKLYIGGEEFKI